LTECAKSGKGNLLGLAIEAAKARATVGEISKALEDVYGRHVPKDNIVRGAYSKEATTKSGDKGK
jgi:methylmalonyl-CoA mutase